MAKIIGLDQVTTHMKFKPIVKIKDHFQKLDAKLMKIKILDREHILI